MDNKEWFFAVKVTLWLCAGFAVSVLGFYVLSKGWNDAAAWGAFGDFVGGLLNPLFAFANLILLVTISYQLKAREEVQAAADRESQRKQSQYELRHQAIREIVRTLNAVPTPYTGDSEYATIIKPLVDDFMSHYQSYVHLFPDQLSNFNHMLESLNTLLLAASTYQRYFGQADEKDLILPLRKELHLHFTHYFIGDRVNFLMALRRSLAD